MTPLTRYLARLLGFDLIIIALALALTHARTILVLQQFLENPPAIFLAGILALGGGLAIVCAHNRWSGGLTPILVTLLGWLSVFKGVILLVFPNHIPGGVFGGALHYSALYILYTAMTFLIGTFLAITSFTIPHRKLDIY